MDPTAYLLPTPKVIKKLEGTFQVFRHTKVVVNRGASPAEKQIAKYLASELDTIVGRSRRITKERLYKRQAIRMHLVDSLNDSAGKLKNDGYVLTVQREEVVVIATMARGLFYGVQTLLQLARITTDIPAVRITDWPDVPNRCVLFDHRDVPVQVPYFKRYLSTLAAWKKNMYMPFMEDDFHYKSHPYLGRPDTFTPKTRKLILEHARKNHIVIVPQLEAFGHGWGLLRHNELKELRLAGRPWEYAPGVPKVYEVLRELLKEICDAFPDSEYLHVGFDEVGGYNPGHSWPFFDDERCRELLNKLGSCGLFAHHAEQMLQIGEGLGRKVMFWHDELTDKPELMTVFPKRGIIVVWLYERMDDFHEVRDLKEKGFTEIWGAPAVHGFNDVYQYIPCTFGNLAGWAREAVKEKLPGVITTTWGPIRGGNVENYFYGLAYSAQVMWNSEASDIADFNRRFAAQWFGITSDEAADHVDRLFWFPWRISGSAPFDQKDITGRWQQQWETHRVFFRNYDELVLNLGIEARWELEEKEKIKHVSPEQVQERLEKKMRVEIEQAKALLKHTKAARRSLEWLYAHRTRNVESLKAMDLIIRIHDHMAKKVIAVYGSALQYRETYAKDPFDCNALALVLDHAIKLLDALRPTWASIEEEYERQVRGRMGDPSDPARVLAVKGSLEQFIGRLTLCRDETRNGSPPPHPEHAGFRSH